MDRALVFLAAFVTLVPAASAQMRIPPEAEPRPPPASTEPTPRASPAPAEPSPSKAIPRGSVLEEVSGTVRSIDRKEHRLTVDTGAGGTVALSLDRNTMVYTASGLGTVLDIAAGSQIRAGRNADFLAYWVQVRARTAPSAPASPAAGTPAGPPPAEAGGATAAPAPAGPMSGGGTGGGTPATGGGPGR